MPKASRFTNGVIIRDGRPSNSTGDSDETKLSQLRIISASLTPAAVGTGQTAPYQTLTLTGLSTSDNFVVCIADPITNNCAVGGAKVNGANSLSLQFVNPTAGAVTPTAGTYVFLVGRYSNT